MNKLVDRFPVKPIQATDIVPVRAGYQCCAPGYTFGPVARDSYTIEYVHAGHGVVYKKGQKIPVSAGQCFILRPGETFRLVADLRDPWTYIWVGFRSSLPLPELYVQDVIEAKEFLMISNSPDSTVMLYTQIAVTTIHTIGNKPNTAPLKMELIARPIGMPHTATATATDGYDFTGWSNLTDKKEFIIRQGVTM